MLGDSRQRENNVEAKTAVASQPWDGIRSRSKTPVADVFVTLDGTRHIGASWHSVVLKNPHRAGRMILPKPALLRHADFRDEPICHWGAPTISDGANCLPEPDTDQFHFDCVGAEVEGRWLGWLPTVGCSGSHVLQGMRDTGVGARAGPLDSLAPACRCHEYFRFVPVRRRTFRTRQGAERDAFLQKLCRKRRSETRSRLFFGKRNICSVGTGSKRLYHRKAYNSGCAQSAGY